MTARRLGIWPDGSPEWHTARASRIGGSDIGAILGWSPFTTPEQLLAEKRGEADHKPTTGAMRRGHYCEPAIAAWLADKEGITYDPDYGGTWVDVDNDWQLYNPDAVTTDGRLVEFKCPRTRKGWGRAGTDQVPVTYAAQATWGMGILGMTECLFGVLATRHVTDRDGACSSDFDFARYRVRFNPDVYRYLRDRAADFLRLMQAERTAA